MNPRTWTAFLAVLLAGGLLFGCGSSNDASSTGPSTGKLSLAVTDAPVDEAAGLYLTINSVTLQGINGSQDQGPYDVTTGGLVNLMEYTGTDSAVVLSDREVPAGTYKVRLDVDLSFSDKDNQQSSWIAFDAEAPECQDLAEGAVPSEGGAPCRYPLTIPSGEQSGFKPKGDLTVEAGGTSHFTVEFNLRQNVVDPQNPKDISYVLKPTGLRLVDNAEVGTISGTIDGTFPPDCALGVSLYDSTDELVTSVGVEGSGTESDPYHYLIGFVPAGTGYSLELTCGSNSLVTTQDSVNVGAGEDTEVDLTYTYTPPSSP